MRISKAKSLSSLLSTAMKAPPKSKPKTLEAIAEQHQASSSSTLALDHSALDLFVSATTSTTKTKTKTKKSKKEEVESSELDSLSGFVFSGVKSQACSDSVEELPPRVDSKQDHVTKRISSILIADALGKSHQLEKEEEEEDDDDDDEKTPFQRELDIPWIPSLTHHTVSLRRKDVVRDRKLTWVFSSSQGGRFNRLVNMCAKKVGTETAFDLFGKLGRATGVKEYNALLKVCVETARLGNTETIILEQIHRAFLYFESMKEHGFQLEEETYGPFLAYLIDTAMVEEFYFFCGIIKDVNPSTASKLGYYEMLLWIEVDDEKKIQELCHHMMTKGWDKGLIENYLLALCEGGREKELLQLLGTIDITNFTSTKSLVAIFKSLGKLQWDALVEKFLLAFKARDFKNEDLSNFICSHVVGNPNLAVDDVISSFTKLHAKLEVKPSSQSYEKLIKHCCGLREVEAALDLFDEIFEGGLTVSLETIHHILRTCEEAYDFNLVHRVYALIRDYNLEASVETFRIMISLCVKMKDMEAAHNMLRGMEEMKLAPTSTIYNVMMSACLRENNNQGVVQVIKQMQEADIKPDSFTFSRLISKCESEKDIDKYWKVLQNSGVQATKAVHMALIHAYATCGLFEKAKQVVTNKGIPVKDLHKVKGVLVQALATHGQFFDALKVYKEIKEAGHNLGNKAVISLIEHYDSDEGSNILLELLEEVTDPEYWLDGCTRIIMYCIRKKDLSPAIDLLNQLKEKLSGGDELVLEAILDKVFSVIGDLEGTHLQIGLDLLRIVKEDLGLTPPRKCLDFLLHACVAAKDLDNSRAIWKEYNAAGHPHNIISFLRMYQALLASEDRMAANILLTKIPKDDPHVRCIIRACQITYAESVTLTTKKQKKKTEKSFANSLIKLITR